MKAAKPIVRNVLRGQVQPLGRGVSAINKHPVGGVVNVHELGLEGDDQADRRVHGGSDKALHCYSWHHYAHWRAELPQCHRWDAPGAFGENLSVDGLDENSVCIGDRWRIGTAECVVTQGRQPCFKLNVRFGVPDMAVRVQESLRAGWYLRVEKNGEVESGSGLLLLDRPHPEHTVARLLVVIRDRVCDPEIIAPILKLPLPANWRKLFERRLRLHEAEDWSQRLNGA